MFENAEHEMITYPDVCPSYIYTFPRSRLNSSGSANDSIRVGVGFGIPVLFVASIKYVKYNNVRRAFYTTKKYNGTRKEQKKFC